MKSIIFICYGLFVVLLICIIIIYIYLPKCNYFYNKYLGMLFLMTNQSSLLYFSTINEKMMKIKNGYSYNILGYLNNLLDFNSNEINAIRGSIELLKNKQLISCKYWNFIKTNNKLEFGMPFTLGNVIFLPNHFVNNITNNNSSISLLSTLCHERIHILQRVHKDFFDEFIINKMKFKKTSINKLPDNLFSNPDGLQTKGESWIIKINKKWYLPYLDFNDNLKKYYKRSI